MKSNTLTFIRHYLPMLTALLLCLLSESSCSKRKSTPQRDYSSGSVVADIPDAVPEELEDTKKQAYLQSGGYRESGSIASEGNIAYDDGASLARMLLSSGDSGKEDETLLSQEEASDTAEDTPEQPVNAKEADSLSRERVFGAPPKEPDSNASMDKGTYVYPGSYKIDEESRLSYDVRRAEAIKAALTSSGESDAVDNRDTDYKGETKESGRNSSAGDTSDPWEGLIEIYNPGESRPSRRGKNSSGSFGSEEHILSSPIKCEFLMEDKVRDGDRITLKTSEDAFIDGTLVPSGTLVSGYCRISDRLYLSVWSIPGEIGHLETSLSAYDSDGLEGLYCPKTASSSGSGKIARESISRGGSIAGGAIGGLAGSIIRSGAAVVSESSSRTRVRIYPGYTFELKFSSSSSNS